MYDPEWSRREDKEYPEFRGNWENREYKVYMERRKNSKCAWT